ncbi:MAG: c-type cytochrome [Limisphaerales bacterium]
MSRITAIVAIVAAGVVGGLAAYWARERVMDALETQNQALQEQLHAAIAKADAKEAELRTARRDSAVLAHLRQEMKTKAPAAAPPNGFYIGKDPPVYVSYGTPDPLLQFFIQSVMTGSDDPMAKGKAIYGKICGACHQADGSGKDGVGPPLVGSEWVLAPGGERLARIVLNGLTGPIRVQGREWNLVMPPWRENLKDEEIAIVLTYIRTSLGTNKSKAITAAVAAAARSESHPGPETSEELLRVSDR